VCVECDAAAPIGFRQPVDAQLPAEPAALESDDVVAQRREVDLAGDDVGIDAQHAAARDQSARAACVSGWCRAKRLGLLVSSKKNVRSGGSSRVLSSALAAETVSSSAPRTMQTTARPSCGEKTDARQHDAPHLLDADAAGFAGLNDVAIKTPLDEQQIGMRRQSRLVLAEGGGALARRAGFAGERCRRFAKQRASERQSCQPLAHAGRPLEAVGVMHLARAERLLERLTAGSWPKQRKKTWLSRSPEHARAGAPVVGFSRPSNHVLASRSPRSVARSSPSFRPICPILQANRVRLDANEAPPIMSAAARRRVAEVLAEGAWGALPGSDAQEPAPGHRAQPRRHGRRSAARRRQ